MNEKVEESSKTGCSCNFCVGEEPEVHVEQTGTKDCGDGQVGTTAKTKLIMNILGKVGQVMTTLYVFCGTEFGIPGDNIKIKLLFF